jgi:hypothetical protein
MATTLKTKLIIRNDVAENWTTRNPKLSKGEVGLETDTLKMKVGDGATQWNALPYYNDQTNTYQDNITTNGKNIGDVAVVTTPIYEDVTDQTKTKVSRTAYVWNGTTWAAMDGNYNAENVYFDEDLVSTYAIGNVTLTDGQGTVESTGKNLKEVWNSIFQKPTDPTVDQPTTTLTVPGNSEKEVGYTFNMPTATLTVTDIGSYSYGPADTGVRFPVGGLTINQTTSTSDSATVVKTYSSESIKTKGDKIQLTADDNISAAQDDDKATAIDKAKGYTYGDEAVKYYFKATSKYTPDANVIPVNNLGTEKPELRIGYNKTGTLALTVSGTPKTVTFTGCRKMFWGTMTSKPATMTSDDIRGLSGLVDTSGSYGTKNANGIKTATGEKSLAIPVGAMRVVIAVPKGRTLSQVLDVNDSSANIISAFESVEVDVKGYNGYTAKTYTVYYTDYAKAATIKNTYKVTIA